jgi:hypothetical protein
MLQGLMVMVGAPVVKTGSYSSGIMVTNPTTPNKTTKMVNSFAYFIRIILNVPNLHERRDGFAPFM